MYDNIPTLLKELNIWLCYDTRVKPSYKNLSDKEIEEMQKAPRDIKGRKTSSKKRLYTFKECLDSINKGFNTGVGIYLKKGVICIDYDNCIDRVEIDSVYGFKRVILKESVKDRIERDINLINSYTEISPSGKGIHIYLLANTSINTKNDLIEIYNNHFIRVTGDVYNDFLFSEVLDRTQELDKLIKMYDLDNKVKGNQIKSVIDTSNNIYKELLEVEFRGQTNKFSDNEILETMFCSKKGKYLKGLYYNTLSDADIKSIKGNDSIDTSNSGKSITLIMYLLDFSYGDLKRVKSLFKKSALCKSEYLELNYDNNTKDKIDYCFIPYAITQYKNYRK